MNDSRTVRSLIRESEQERFPLAKPAAAKVEPEGGEDEAPSRCYASVRGQRDRAAALEFRTGRGESFTLDWAWMPDVLWDPSGGITLVYASRGFRVRIRGRALWHLKEKLRLRTVLWMQAIPPDQDDENTRPDAIYSFEVQPLKDGDEVKLLAGVLGQRVV